MPCVAMLINQICALKSVAKQHKSRAAD